MQVNQIHLENELNELETKYPNFKDEDLFQLWFLRAYITSDEDLAAKSITNGPNDKGLDAILIDDAGGLVCLVQTKYRKILSKKYETKKEVLDFSNIAGILTNSDNETLKEFIKDAVPLVAERLKIARNKIHKRGYKLNMYYVTLGKFNPDTAKQVKKVSRANGSLVELLDGKRVMILLKDYFDGVAPPVPSVDLEMEKGHGVKINGVYQRYDTRNEIESWVFSMKGNAIAELFNSWGTRLFARNIRGFLGENTSINAGMSATLESEAENFFYYNNGITIICDMAKKESQKGMDILQIHNPQIINGQQTTRMLSANTDRASKSSVLVRVLQVPRRLEEGKDDFDSIVSRIVAGTNWQNSMRPSDLMSNDRRQIEIERELRKLGYLYLRKRQSKSEAKRAAGGNHYLTLYKEELAQAVAGCDLDPVIVRSGKDKLFEENIYHQIFPNSNPNYYLPRFLLSKEVKYCAKGYPERAYAKWLVLRFMWLSLEPCLSTENKRKNFWNLCQSQDLKLVNPLNTGINKVFSNVMKYYRKNCGKGQKRIDVSTFFRNKKGRDKEFQKFWKMREGKTGGLTHTLEKLKKSIIT